LLENSVQARDRWLAERTKADWQTMSAVENQSFGEKLSHMFLGNMLDRKKKK